MMKYLLLGILFLSPFISFARDPLASELNSFSINLGGTTSIVTGLATTSDPYFITGITVTHFNAGQVIVYCGNTKIYYEASDTSQGKRPISSTPYRCTGAIKASSYDGGGTVNRPTSVYISGYTMSDLNYDLQPATGGGGGGEVTVDIDLEPLYLFLGILLFLSTVSFVVRNLKKSKL